MHSALSLDQLCDALEEIYRAADVSIKRDAGTPTPRLKGSRKPNAIHYPTHIYIQTKTLLGGQHIKYLRELELDEASSSCARALIEQFQQPGTKQLGALTRNPSELKAILNAVKELNKTIEQCQSSYENLTIYQRRAIAEAMRQTIWPQPMRICTDFITFSSVLSQYLVCKVCALYHDSKICFQVLSTLRPMYSVRLKLVERVSWQAFDVGHEIASKGPLSPLQVLDPSECLSRILNNQQQAVYVLSDQMTQRAYIVRGEEGNGVDLNPIKMVSLRSWISQGQPCEFKKVKRRQRITLALLIAYYYLHLGGSELWPDKDVVPDVWFEASRADSCDVYRPFISLRNEPDRNSPFGRESFNNPGRPSLPALGKLLLEVWCARALSWDDIQNNEVPTEYYEDSDIGALFYVAVSRCWTAKSIRDPGLLKYNQSMQDEYTSWIIKILQHILGLYNVCQDDVFGEDKSKLSHGEAFSINHPAEKLALRPVQVTKDVALDISDDDADDLSQNFSPMSSVTNPDKNDFCLREDGSTHAINPEHKASAEAWFREFEEKCLPYLKKLRGERSNLEMSRVKVAVLDTGACFDKNVHREIGGKRIKEYRSWCSDIRIKKGIKLDRGEDNDGHGTQSTGLLLKVASQSLVYVAKIFESRSHGSNGGVADDVTALRIADAIEYAVDEWKVDVISMSFGFEERIECVREAIAKATRASVLMFASASNYGALRPITYPAMDKNVFSIHAMTGKGNAFELTTTGEEMSSNFATVGSNVSTWSVSKGKNIERYCSGSSVATPITSGIAACVIEMMRCAKDSYLESCSPLKREDEEKRYQNGLNTLKRKEGMQAVFEMIVGRTGQRAEYSFLAPATFIREANAGFDTTKIDNILEALRNI